MMQNEQKLIKLSGRIDSNNAAEAEKNILTQLEGFEGGVVLDAQTLEYISSAGLRVILHLKKQYDDLSLTNVNSDVYEVLSMTGFTEMMNVEKAYREVSLEGCEMIGEGFNASVYRMDNDTVVKVYKNGDVLSEIKQEREVARLALILGVPTAISYDVVRVGNSYGSVFELLNAQSFSEILAKQPDRMDWCVKEYVDMLHTIHSISVPEGKLPSIKASALEGIKRILPMLSEGCGEKLWRMANEIPETDRMVHGDYHTRNIVLADGEVLLIDMDKLSVGHPIFELAQIFNSYIGFSECDHDIVKRFQGIDQRTASLFFERSLRAYLKTEDDARVDEVKTKLRCIAYARLIDWRIRHTALETEADRLAVEHWRSELIELISRVDTLCFETEVDEAALNELVLPAETERLQTVLQFVERHLEAVDCPAKTMMHISLAVEEVFVNIASYAYAPDKGSATVRVEVSDEPITVTITFLDHGVPYDPLKKPDPDLTLPLQQREPGGLGIFMTKQLVDDVSYEYRDGMNILTLKKMIGG